MYRELYGTQQVSTSGLHELLRAAGLPREELLHMGATHALLSSSAPAWTARELAAALLGRIVWDAIWGSDGFAYNGRISAPLCRIYGAGVIEEWFS